MMRRSRAMIGRQSMFRLSWTYFTTFMQNTPVVRWNNEKCLQWRLFNHLRCDRTNSDRWMQTLQPLIYPNHMCVGQTSIDHYHWNSYNEQYMWANITAHYIYGYMYVFIVIELIPAKSRELAHIHVCITRYVHFSWGIQRLCKWRTKLAYLSNINVQQFFVNISIRITRPTIIMLQLTANEFLPLCSSRLVGHFVQTWPDIELLSHSAVLRL